MQDTITALDGAGPIILSVYKTQGSATTYTQDVVTVTFSEPVQFNSNSVPVGMFNVYDSTRAVRDSLMLAGIPNLEGGNNGSTVSFYMSNDSDLTVNQLFNLTTTGSSMVHDTNRWNGQGNPPAQGNRKVWVVVGPPKQHLANSIVNPVIGTHKGQNGITNYSLSSDPKTWLQDNWQGHGTVFNFTYNPSNIKGGNNASIGVSVSVYDAAGNMVSSANLLNLVKWIGQQPYIMSSGGQYVPWTNSGDKYSMERHQQQGYAMRSGYLSGEFGVAREPRDIRDFHPRPAYCYDARNQ